jgi:predicted TIM-barrel fold metal-dependent hydrolase
MPMRDPAPQLAWVCYAKISEADKRKILGENAKRLLMRCFTKKES